MDFPDEDDVMPPGELAERTAALQTTVAEIAGRACACGRLLCGHDAVLAVVLGYKTQPRCPTCLAASLREDRAGLGERAWQWIVRRDCFRFVWRAASVHEGYGPVDRTPCFVGDPAPSASAPAREPTVPVEPAHAAATWHAGDLGCGDLVLELRLRLAALPAAAVLHVTARDPAAPVDLPAWCGLTGHTLLRASHPDYWIQRKRE